MRTFYLPGFSKRSRHRCVSARSLLMWRRTWMTSYQGICTYGKREATVVGLDTFSLSNPFTLCVNRDILAAVAYFDLFDYPLTQSEIFSYLRNACSHESFTEGLQHLTSTNHLRRFGEFYTLQDDPALVTRRRLGNQKAKRLLLTARKIAGFLSAFPFVRGVAVSGSLSKNYADEDSDIDFFIITSPNRLWLARTFMHVFKKLTYLGRKQHWFCMNYYIDGCEMQIREKNIYTAIEIATLMPLRGIRAFDHFYFHNAWAKELLPNQGMKVSYLKENQGPLVKKIFELLLDNALGNLIDNLLMKMTTTRWARKTALKKLNAKGSVLGMDGGKHYAKNRPETFQNKLIDRYEKKIYDLFISYDSKIENFY